MKPVPDQIKAIRDLVNGYKMSQVLITAEELGIFARVAVGPIAANEIGVAAGGVPAERIEPLLNVLAGAAVLTRDADGRYALSEDFATLDPRHKASQNGYLQYAARVAEKWTRLADAVRRANVADANFDEITGADRETAAAFAAAMDANAKPQAAFIAQQYDFSGRRILDVGAGAGTYSIEVATRFPDSRLALLETPGMVDVLKAFVDRANLSSRLQVLSGDYRESLPEPPYDDIFMFAVVHQEQRQTVLSMLRHAREALARGGRLFLTSFFLDESRTEPPFSAMFAVEMLVMVGSGRVYTFREIAELLAEAGFQDVARRDEIPGPATLFVATSI